MRWLTLLALLGALVGASASVSVQRTQATECPGKIVCPLIGEEICRCCCPLNGK
ncbi:hypothetical protein HRbin17_02505 [bacterium HR17]|uniref:Uncharacterized protein n=1 Tax=Candidatus Fervidibacter japonicus TaxID=2035412 RepID=A0A2H5XFL4_9BACT|nr:hypothetical protein HRbin17_02505 [bacterium HR17]